MGLAAGGHELARDLDAEPRRVGLDLQGVEGARQVASGHARRLGLDPGADRAAQGRFGSGAETGAVTPARRIPAGTAERNRVGIRQRLCGKVRFGVDRRGILTPYRG